MSASISRAGCIRRSAFFILFLSLLVTQCSSTLYILPGKPIRTPSSYKLLHRYMLTGGKSCYSDGIYTQNILLPVVMSLNPISTCPHQLFHNTHRRSSIIKAVSILRGGSSDSNHIDIPIIQTLLMPRNWSIPHMIRLLLVFSFTIFFFEAIRTMGLPYQDSILKILASTSSTTSNNPITALDEYMAQLIAQGQNEILPPKYMPSAKALLGMITVVFLYIFGTILFPRWFLPFHVWLYYDQTDISTDCTMSIQSNQRFLPMKLRKGRYRRRPVDETTLDYYSSNLLQRHRHPVDKNKQCTGIALLIGSSSLQRTIQLSSTSSSSHGHTSEDKITWLYFSEDFDSRSDHDITSHKNSTFVSHPLPYYFEWDQRRIYVDFVFQPSKKDGTTSCIIQYKDGSPDFFKALSLEALVSPCIKVIHSKNRYTTKGSFLLALNHEALEVAKQRFGTYNNITLPTPSIRSAFISRISSPLSVLQVMGRLLTALEETFLPMMFNIGFVWLQHYLGTKQSISAAKELVREVQGDTQETAQLHVWVLRPTTVSKGKKTKARWTQIHCAELLPGDLFFLPILDDPSIRDQKTDASPHHEIIMPVDALILGGSCVAREAVITGEAVAQAKVSINANRGQMSPRCLDIDGIDRNSILFAGTTIISSQNEEPPSHIPHELSNIFKKTGSCPIPCLVLRTGSSSSKGEIVRALAKSSTVLGTVSTRDIELDSLRLIFSLSACALIACISLFIPGLQTNPTQSISAFRRVIQCTRIAVASVPSDLPLMIASIVQTCSSYLRKESDVVCSDAAALIKAAQIDTIVWDKTGTLTDDTQSLKFVIHPPLLTSAGERITSAGERIKVTAASSRKIMRGDSTHPMLDSVLLGCHSLTLLMDKKDSFRPLGDPLDIACLNYCKYNYAADRIFTLDTKDASSSLDTVKVKKLWQLKTFSFDPNRRCSSALVLTLHHDNQFRLWVLIKGAADSLLTRMQRINSHISAESFRSWYENTTRNIERLGMRVIALGVKDVSSDSRFLSHLFPEGLHMLRDDQHLIFKLKDARKWANDYLERSVVEDVDLTPCDDELLKTVDSFDFVGFCCFEAALRRSSGRVVTALNRSGVRSIICTGDSVEAASAAAKSVGILSRNYTAVLEVHQHYPQELVWKLSNIHQSMASHHLIPFQKLSLSKLWANRRQYSVCLTGDALSLLSDIHNDRVLTDGVTRITCSDFLRKLHYVTILARASPSKKQLFVSHLKEIGCKVVMCGDGVNDVAALRESDLSVALLNGYSDISTLQGDVEDEPILQGDAEDDRRRDRWRRNRMGANSSPAQIRFLHNLEAIQKSSERSQPKDIVSAYLYALRKELDRIKRLRDGGAKAAQVLAEDDRLLRHMSGANIEGTKTDATGLIKSGEACLAAKFTCLRPCIDGVEYIIRHGIAASAFSLTLRRVIFLNSLMACFNLATLYRNGFRYGRYMWNVELFFAMTLDKEVYRMSCSPRPRVSQLRPSQSIFHISTLVPLIGQALIHIIILSKGAEIFSSLPGKSTSLNHKRLSLRFADAGVFLSAGSNTNPILRFVPRERFRPNLLTNYVFILSIAQNTIIALTNQLGKPYQEDILECRSVMLWAFLSLLFCTILVTEEFPLLNQLLELAPWPNTKAKAVMILLLAFDALASIGLRYLTRYPQRHRRYLREDVRTDEAGNAADYEVKALAHDRGENVQLLWVLVCLLTTVIVKGLLL